MILAFENASTVFLYNSGYDPQYASFSIGLASKALILGEAIEAGRRCADFLRGHEPYKYDLGGKDRQVYKATVRR